MRNPFTHRQAVADPSQVFGRTGIARELFEMIASRQSCAVVGERRIGKSTLLTYLASPAVQAAHGLDPASMLTASLDFLALHGMSPDELWVEILDALAVDVGDSEVAAILGEHQGTTMRFVNFRRILRQLSRRGLRIVLLCDELDVAVHNPLFDEAFFGGLRSLAGEGVAFVTASRASLFELDQYRSEEARRKVMASPFFNIFAEFFVGPFADADVAEWLAASLDPTPIRFDAQDIRWLDAHAGRHPFFLQLAAYHLFGELERAGLGRTVDARPEPSGTSDRGERRQACRVEAACRVREEGAKVFRHHWVHSVDDERAILARLARARESDGSGHHLALSDVEPDRLRRLVTRGLLMREPGGETGEVGRHRLFSEPFRQWLRLRASVTDSAPTRHPSPDVDPDAPTLGLWTNPAPERYQLLEELGQGGTATVFKAWDARLERLVALKRLDAALRSSPKRLRALVSEARACAGLHHPGVVIVHDIDPERGFLVEELLGGGSLRDLLEQTPVLSDDDRVALARQLADALAAAHSASVLHGDLKPENILLAERPVTRGDSGSRLPTVKLTDFGAAVRLDGSAVARGGTIAYMAPEQLDGRSVGPAADVYAFGVVLFESGRGRLPDPAGPLDRDDETSSSALDRLISRCLAVDPGDRFADGRALAAAVQTARGA
ncbi:MAG: protein kinase [Acidobacteriota bacterium]